MSQFPPPNSPLNYATPPPPVSIWKRRFRNGLFGWLVFIGLAVMLIILVQQSKKQVTDIPLNELYDRLAAGDVQSLTVEADAVHGVFRTPISLPSMGVTLKYFKAPLPTGTTGNWAFTEWLLENRHGAQIDVSNEQSLLTSIILPLVPWILIFGFIWLFVIRKLVKVRQVTPSPTLPAGPIEVIIVNREPK